MFGSQRFGSQNPFGGASQGGGSQKGEGGATACRECGSDAVEEQDGVYVCSVCGVQSQDLFVEETEWQAGVNTGEGRHLRRRREKRVKAAPVAPAQPRDIALAYAECLQRHLVALCDALAGAHHLKRQSVLHIAMQLWRTYLPMTDVFRSTGIRLRGKPVGKAAAAPVSSSDVSSSSSDGSDSSSSSHDSEGDTSSDEDPGAGGAPGKQPRQRNGDLRTELHARLPLLTPLAIAYLAVHWLRAPVVHTDVIRACLDGTLPWLGFHATLPRELTGLCPVGTLVMTSVPTPRILHVAAAAIAQATGMQCPPVNAAALAERFARELALPARAGKEAATLLVLHEPPGLWLGAPPGTPGATHFAGDTTPATHVMAALLFVLKAVYRLGEPPRVQEPTEPAGPDTEPEAAPEPDPEFEPGQEPELEPEPSEPDPEPEPGMASDEEYKYDMPMLDSSSGDEGGDVSADEAEALPEDDEAGADEEEEDQQPVQKPAKAKKLRCGKRCKNGCQRHMCPCFRVRCATIASCVFRHHH
jgi:transcription initiation factor TFIIIB Brf1 subunit/transcription initiation factor TFIIB